MRKIVHYIYLCFHPFQFFKNYFLLTFIVSYNVSTSGVQHSVPVMHRQTYSHLHSKFSKLLRELMNPLLFENQVYHFDRIKDKVGLDY